MKRASTVAFLLVASLAAQGEPKSVEVRRADFSVHLKSEGVFRARRTTRVSSLVSGRVGEVLASEGDRVRRGDILVRLESDPFEAEVRQREAESKAARVEADGARVKLQRTEELRKGGMVTEEECDQARTAVESAQARFEQAEASLRAARERLDETRILAPFDGVVTKRLVDEGEVVTNAPVVPLLEVQEVEHPDLEFTLPQEQADRVQVGMSVEFVLEGGKGTLGKGRLAVVSPDIDEKTQTLRCRAVCEEGERTYRPGLRVRVRVIVAVVREALVVPRAALLQKEGGWEVQVVEGTKAVERKVTLGEETEEEVQVVAGLSEGERVLIPGGK